VSAAPFTKVATGISRQLYSRKKHRLQPGWSNWEELGWLLVAMTLPLVKYAGRNVVLLNEAEARTLRNALLVKPGRSRARGTSGHSKPAPPFTTSTCNKKLTNYVCRHGTHGLPKVSTSRDISYMRTDSVHLSEQAIAAARSCVEQLYGKQYLSPKPRYTTKAKALKKPEAMPSG